MMAVGANFLDAGQRGGLARFINHSCEPNAEAQIWDVAGERRVGIFALKDVGAGTELCFDYKWERKGFDPIICRCGTPSCRGFLGGRGEGGKGVPAGRFRKPSAAELGAARTAPDGGLSGRWVEVFFRASLHAARARASTSPALPSGSAVIATAPAGGQSLDHTGWYAGRVLASADLTAAEARAAGWGARRGSDDGDEEDEEDGEEGEAEGGSALPGLEADDEVLPGLETGGSAGVRLHQIEFRLEGGPKRVRWERLRLSDEDEDDEDDEEEDDDDDDDEAKTAAKSGVGGVSARFHVLQEYKTVEDAAAAVSDAVSVWSDPDASDDEGGGAGGARADPLLASLLHREMMRRERGPAPAAAGPEGSPSAGAWGVVGPSASPSAGGEAPGVAAGQVGAAAAAAPASAGADAGSGLRASEDAGALARRLADEARVARAEEAQARASAAAERAQREAAAAETARAEAAERLRAALRRTEEAAIESDARLRREEAEAARAALVAATGNLSQAELSARRAAKAARRATRKDRARAKRTRRKERDGQRRERRAGRSRAARADAAARAREALGVPRRFSLAAHLAPPLPPGALRQTADAADVAGSVRRGLAALAAYANGGRAASGGAARASSAAVPALCGDASAASPAAALAAASGSRFPFRVAWRLAPAELARLDAAALREVGSLLLALGPRLSLPLPLVARALALAPRVLLASRRGDAPAPSAAAALTTPGAIAAGALAAASWSATALAAPMGPSLLAPAVPGLPPAGVLLPAAGLGDADASDAPSLASLGRAVLLLLAGDAAPADAVALTLTAVRATVRDKAAPPDVRAAAEADGGAALAAAALADVVPGDAADVAAWVRAELSRAARAARAWRKGEATRADVENTSAKPREEARKGHRGREGAKRERAEQKRAHAAALAWRARVRAPAGAEGCDAARRGFFVPEEGAAGARPSAGVPEMPPASSACTAAAVLQAGVEGAAGGASCSGAAAEKAGQSPVLGAAALVAVSRLLAAMASRPQAAAAEQPAALAAAAAYVAAADMAAASSASSSSSSSSSVWVRAGAGQSFEVKASSCRAYAEDSGSKGVLCSDGIETVRLSEADVTRAVAALVGTDEEWSAAWGGEAPTSAAVAGPLGLLGPVGSALEAAGRAELAAVEVCLASPLVVRAGDARWGPRRVVVGAGGATLSDGGSLGGPGTVALSARPEARTGDEEDEEDEEDGAGRAKRQRRDAPATSDVDPSCVPALLVPGSEAGAGWQGSDAGGAMRQLALLRHVHAPAVDVSGPVAAELSEQLGAAVKASHEDDDGEEEEEEEEDGAEAAAVPGSVVASRLLPSAEAAKDAAASAAAAAASLSRSGGGVFAAARPSAADASTQRGDSAVRFLGAGLSAAVARHPFILLPTELVELEGHAGGSAAVLFEPVAHDLAGLLVAGVRLGAAQSQRVAGEVVRALRRCHERGVAHRRLSPAAVCLTAQGSTRLGDFTAARWAPPSVWAAAVRAIAGHAVGPSDLKASSSSSSSSSSSPGQGLATGVELLRRQLIVPDADPCRRAAVIQGAPPPSGTALAALLGPDALPSAGPAAASRAALVLTCAAPEVLLGGSGVVLGPAADAWALGCTLAHLFLGRPLFGGTSPADVVAEQAALLGRTDVKWPGVKRLPLWPAVERGVVAAAARAGAAAGGAAVAAAGTAAGDDSGADGPSSARVALAALGMSIHQAALLAELLRVDPSERLTSRGASAHAYLRSHRPPAELGTRLLGAHAIRAAGMDPEEALASGADLDVVGVAAPRSAVPAAALAEAAERQTAAVRALLGDPFPLLRPLRLAGLAERAAAGEAE